MTVAPPQSRATRWLIAGAVLLVLLGVAGVVVLVALGTGEDGPPAGQPATGSPSPSTNDQFGPEPDLCAATDRFAPVFEILPVVEVADDAELDDGGFYQRACTFRLGDDASAGHLIVYAAIYSAPQDARNGYRDRLGPAAGLRETQEELAGDWDEAALLLDESSADAAAQVVALDGGLVLDLTCTITGDAHDLPAQREAVVRVTEHVREAMRR